jgi:hypothetical protein
MGIEEAIGKKNESVVDAMVEKLRHENPNYKAIVVITDNKKGEDNKSIISSVTKLVPFTSIVKANDYIYNELPALGFSGLLLEINKEERIFYSVKYTINSIYGKVTFFKNYDNRTKDEMLYMKEQLCENNGYGDYNNYFTINIRGNDGQDIFNSDSIIHGLPIGITDDMCFKMSLLQNLKSMCDETSKNGVAIGSTLMNIKL